jgi:ketosteroid isomerase-like protein
VIGRLFCVRVLDLAGEPCRKIHLLSIVLGLVCLRVVPGILNAQAMLSPAEQEVWQMELKLVEFSNAGNIEGFLGLFHKDHVGCSRNDPKPGTKEDRRKTLSMLLRDGRLAHAIVNREPLSVRLYGDVAIVFYRERDIRPDGGGKRVESSVRTTHTWKRTGDGWELIGGMSTVEAPTSGTANPQSGQSASSTGSDQGRTTVTRIYTGPDGQTHAGKTDVKLTPWAGHGGYNQSDTVKASSLRFVRRPPGWAEDWHHASQRQYIITLSGRGEVEVSGGQKIPLEPGRVLLGEDLTGKGHITRALGSEDWVSLHIRLADQ